MKMRLCISVLLSYVFLVKIMKKFNDSRFLPRKTLTSLLPDLYFVVNRILLPRYMFHSWTFNFKEFSMCTGSAPTASEHSSLNCMEDHFSGHGP